MRPGDTLYSLSWAAGVDYRELAAWNGLASPYVIHPGQRISLVPTGRAPAASNAGNAAGTRVSALPQDGNTGATSVTPLPSSSTPRPDAAGSGTRQSVSKEKRVTSKPAPERKPAVPATPGPTPTPGAWMWPVRGSVVASFSQSRGVDIAVGSGTPVKASAAGQVVYAGSGLRGYGQLIIVKHSAEYLSAYGHNRKLLVEEGDRIASGQVIAESGSAPGKGEQVHFEIRRNGRPVDPLSLLPARSG